MESVKIKLRVFRMFDLPFLNLPLDLQFELFVCSVLPIMSYRSEIWLTKTVRKIVQEVPQSQVKALPRHQENEETSKPKQA